MREVDRSPLHHLYYDNAVKFAKFSAGPIFRSEGLHPPHLGELGFAALDARRARTPLSKHHQFMLKDLSRSGAEGDAVAQFVRAIAAGYDPPRVPNGLTSGLQRYLSELSLAAVDSVKLFQLVPCAIEAVCMRLCGTPISEAVDAVLTDLEHFGRDGKQVSKFLRDLSTGAKLILPRRLSKGMRPFLKQAVAWVNEGKVPSGLVGHVAEECLKVRLGYCTLDEQGLRTLAAMEATGESWSEVAGFLRAVAAGDDPAVPTSIAEPIHSNLVRLSCGSRLAGVQLPRTNEIMSVGFGDPATNIDLFSLIHMLRDIRGKVSKLPKEAEHAIRKFEAAAPERAIVGQRIRSLIADEPPLASPDSLPAAIGLLLIQIEAVAKGEPTPIDPSLVGLASIRARHSGGAMGDCIMFSLHAMARARPEAKTLADYLWNIAHGGPAGPAPILKDPQLAAVAEEVRCLADKEVGGIRMMMTQAKKPPQRGSALDQNDV